MKHVSCARKGVIACEPMASDTLESLHVSLLILELSICPQFSGVFLQLSLPGTIDSTYFLVTHSPHFSYSLSTPAVCFIRVHSTTFQGHDVFIVRQTRQSCSCTHSHFLLFHTGNGVHSIHPAPHISAQVLPTLQDVPIRIRRQSRHQEPPPSPYHRHPTLLYTCSYCATYC